MNNVPLTNTRLWLLKHHQKMLLVLVSLGFVSSMSVQGWGFYQSLVATPPNSAPDSTRIQPKQTESPALRMVDFSLLFGEAKEQPKAVNASNLPSTSLRLTLRGALAPVSAIIQGSDGRDRLYTVGDTIPGGSVLESVHPQYVVIKHRGNLQRLSFPKLGNKEALPGATPAVSNSVQKLPNGPLAEVKELERKLDQIQQRAERK